MDNALATILLILGATQVELLTAAGGEGSALEQRTQSFAITLNGSVEEVTPLFGPVRETEWAPDWKPHFLHPRQPKQEEGAVFTTASVQGRDRFWVLADYSTREGRVEYIVISPGLTLKQVRIQVVADSPRQCKATITYRDSALSAEGNDEVKRLDKHWAEQQRIHWETAINSLIRNRLAHE